MATRFWSARRLSDLRPGSTRSLSLSVSALVLGLALAVLPQDLLGQTVSLSAGAAPYDLSGTGTSAIAAVRLDVQTVSWLSIQGGSSYFWYTTQAAESVAMLIPEIGVMAGVAGTPLYLGAGVGHTVLAKGSWPEAVTLYAALGADIEDRGGWGLRPEARIHSVDPWAGTIVAITFGVRRRLGAD